MWNPFKNITLKAILPAKETTSAIGSEKTDPIYIAEMERAKLRSMAALTGITMIHEQLASGALRQLRGERICHD